MYSSSAKISHHKTEGTIGGKKAPVLCFSHQRSKAKSSCIQEVKHLALCPVTNNTSVLSPIKTPIPQIPENICRFYSPDPKFCDCEHSKCSPTVLLRLVVWMQFQWGQFRVTPHLHEHILLVPSSQETQGVPTSFLLTKSEFFAQNKWVAWLSQQIPIPIRTQKRRQLGDEPTTPFCSGLGEGIVSQEETMRILTPYPLGPRILPFTRKGTAT